MRAGHDALRASRESRMKASRYPVGRSPGGLASGFRCWGAEHGVRALSSPGVMRAAQARARPGEVRLRGGRVPGCIRLRARFEDRIRCAEDTGPSALPPQGHSADRLRTIRPLKEPGTSRPRPSRRRSAPRPPPTTILREGPRPQKVRPPPPDTRQTSAPDWHNHIRTTSNDAIRLNQPMKNRDWDGGKGW